MLYVFFVAQAITNTTRLFNATKIHCVCCPRMFCLERHIESVLVVIHTLTIFCCCHTQNGISPVCVASHIGHPEIVDLLVYAGADINLATNTKVHVSTHSVFSSSSCGD